MHDRITVFLRVYKKLATDALERGRLLFAVKPKHHFLEHIAMTIKEERLHPRLYLNFGEEDPEIHKPP